MKKTVITRFTDNDTMTITWLLGSLKLNIFYDDRGSDWKIFVSFHIFGFRLFNFFYRDEHKRQIYCDIPKWKRAEPWKSFVSFSPDQP